MESSIVLRSIYVGPRLEITVLNSNGRDDCKYLLTCSSACDINGSSMSMMTLSRSLDYLQRASPKTPLTKMKLSREYLAPPIDEGYVPLGASYEQHTCQGARIPACSTAGFH